MKILTAQILANEVNGTWNDLEMVIDELVEEHGYTRSEPEITMYQELDNICFQCDQCGWWFDICNQADDDTCRCNSCAEED